MAYNLERREYLLQFHLFEMLMLSSLLVLLSKRILPYLERFHFIVYLFELQCAWLFILFEQHVYNQLFILFEQHVYSCLLHKFVFACFSTKLVGKLLLQDACLIWSFA